MQSAKRFFTHTCERYAQSFPFYSSRGLRKTHLKFSIQSTPFGSSLEKTKQLNAFLNCSPQGPCAMPPRHGQSQLISPVSSLKAPSWLASCSRPSGSEEGAGGALVAALGVGATVAA